MAQAAARANNLSQLNTVTEIKYISRNSTARDHSMIAVRVETPIHGLARSLARYRPREPNPPPRAACTRVTNR